MFIHVPPTETPRVIERLAVIYVGISSVETLSSIGSVFAKEMPKLAMFLQKHDLHMIGAPFLRYTWVNMKSGIGIVLGVPTAKRVAGDGTVEPGVLPSGRYVSLTHFGNYSGLEKANGELQRWTQSKHLRFKMKAGKHGPEFVSRLEIYETDPAKEHNPTKWKTVIDYQIEP